MCFQTAVSYTHLLQSVHINLPFANDEEFGKLHAAIRIALPLLPALAASSPVVEGRVTGKLDSRLDFYMQNQKRIPSIIGSVIPEAVFTQKDYEEKILHKIYKDIAPSDPDEILQDEWLNSRGAIARFQRNAIEIRVLDIQESVQADFGVISLVISLVQSLVDEKWLTLGDQKLANEKDLRVVFQGAAEEGGAYELKDSFLLKAFGEKAPLSLNALWTKICARLIDEKYPVRDFAPAAQRLLKGGTLSSRLRGKLGASPSREEIVQEYKQLARCLQDGSFYG